MEYHHNHRQPIPPTRIKRALIAGIVLNFLVVLIELIAGLKINSLSLLSDAGHNLADVGVLSLSLLAYLMMKKKSSQQFTYGYSKTSILIALFNAVVLLVSIGAITVGSINRLIHPQPLPGNIIALVAGIAIVINVFTALLFVSDQKRDLNLKSAYLHLMSDAAVSLAIVVGGIIMWYTSWYWIDPILSIVIAAVIMIATWRLLRDSIRLSLDGVPQHINLTTIRESVLKVPGVKDLHHIHIWGISTAENALTAHLVLDNNTTSDKEKEIKMEVRRVLGNLDIHHITLETERERDLPDTDKDRNSFN